MAPFRAGLLCLAVVGITSCHPEAPPRATTAATPRAVLTDQTHAFGTAGFYWLPPILTSEASFVAANFDGTASPTVKVELLRSDGNITLSATLSGAQITISTTANANFPGTTAPFYGAKWTPGATATVGQTYRVHVDAQGNVNNPPRVLGVADVVVVADQAAANAVDRTKFVPLIASSSASLDIAFRLEKKDTDGDTVYDWLDNCYITSNFNQLDSNGDGVGDACQCLNKPNGTACSTGCKTGETCSSGACTGGTAKENGTSCNSGNPCKKNQTCTSGTCGGGSNAEPGLACSTGNPCKQNQTCSNGTCGGGSNKATGTACTTGNQCKQSETCSSSGTCGGGSNKATGTTCSTGNTCKQNETCTSGTCGGGSNKSNGSACSDNSLCTQSDTCQTGVCIGASPITCVAQGQCYTVGTCSPLLGACTSPVKDNGSTCDDGLVCTPNESCRAGACITGSGPAINTFAIYAGVSLYMHLGSVVGGDIGVKTPGGPYGWSNFSISLPDASTVDATKTVYAPSVLLNGGAHVGSVLTDRSDFVGGTYTSTGPFPTMPAMPTVPVVTAGGSTLEVVTNTTLNLAPTAAYNVVNVRAGATLRLNGGLYQFNMINVYGGGRVEAATPIDLRLGQGIWTAGQNTYIGPQPGTTLTAKDLLIRISSAVQSGFAADFGDGQVRALILAPAGQITARGNTSSSSPTQLKGAFICQSFLNSPNPNVFVVFEDGFPLPAAPTCNDGNPCNGVETCGSNGSCETTPVVLDDGNPCTADSCDAMGVKHTPVTNGTLCTDGNGCTLNDACQAGTCVAGAPKVCPGADQCNSAGTCDPLTGVCSAPVPLTGTMCNDQSACTTMDTCVSGQCGGTAITCSALDQCHTAGTCDPSNGICSNPLKAAGSSCTDGNACNGAETCNASGICTAGTAIVCGGADQCHAAGTCDPMSGACSPPVALTGTVCNDGLACTSGDVCNAGTCGGTSTCDDGDPCTVADSCGANNTCQFAQPDPACVASHTTPVVIAPNGYEGVFCVQGWGCALAQYDLPRGTYTVSARTTSDLMGNGTDSLGTLTVSPAGVLSAGDGLENYFSIAGSTLTAITKTIVVDPQGFDDYVTIDGVRNIWSAAGDVSTVSLLVNRRYTLRVLNTADLNGAVGTPDPAKWGLELQHTATADTIVFHGETAASWQPPTGLTIKPIVAPVVIDMKTYPGAIGGRGWLPVYGTATRYFIVGRRYQITATPAAYHPTELTARIGDNDYPLAVKLDKTVQIIGNQGSLIASGATVVARVADVTVRRRNLIDGICLGRIDCLDYPAPSKTMHLLVDRRYEVPGGYATPPTGQLVTVPAQGVCTPTPVTLNGEPIDIECQVDQCLGRPNGETCTDGDRCTVNDTCQAGVCVSGGPIDCGGEDQCHSRGVCDPLTGTCSAPVPLPDGTMCADQSACTGGDTCLAGQCGGTTLSCSDGDPCTADSCDATGGCHHGPRDPSCHGVSLHVDPAGYKGLFCVQGFPCGQTDMDLQPGSYDIGTRDARDLNDGYGAPIGTVAVGADRSVTFGGNLSSYFYPSGNAESGVVLTALTSPVSLDFRGYGDLIGLAGIGYFEGSSDVRTMILLRGRRYSVLATYTVGLNGNEGSIPGGLDVSADGRSVSFFGQTADSFESLGGLQAAAKVATVTVDFKTYEGPIGARGFGEIGGPGLKTTNLIIGRRYSLVAHYNYNPNDLTWNLGNNDYPLHVNLNGSVSLDGGDGPFSWSGSTLTARIADVEISRNGYPYPFCIGQSTCFQPGPTSHTAHLLAGRRYELPHTAQIPPTGTLVVVPAAGACSPATVPLGGYNLGIQCQVNPCQDPQASCDDGNPCTADACSPTAGCTHTPVANGISCSDGNACTQTDSCQAGVCTGSAPVVCTASDQCHGVGTCDQSTGLCSNPLKVDGTSCSDGNACTQGDTCLTGSCTAGSPVICGGADECNQAGLCDPLTGACSAPRPLPDGALCSDRSICTSADTCLAGQCGGTAVVCDDDDPCTADSCSAVSGCSFTQADPACVAAGTVAVYFNKNGYTGDFCVQGFPCVAGAPTNYSLARGTYDITAPSTSDFTGGLNNTSLGTLTIGAGGTLIPGGGLTGYFQIAGTTLTAITKTVNFAMEGYGGRIDISGQGSLEGEGTSLEKRLLVGRRYNVTPAGTTSLNSQADGNGYNLQLDIGGVAATPLGSLADSFMPLGGLNLQARVTPVAIDLKTYLGSVSVTGVGGVSGTGTVVLLKGRRYQFVSQWAYGLSDLTPNLGSNLYPLRAYTDTPGTVSIDGGDSSFAITGATIAARIVDVNIIRNSSPDALCFGGIVCSQPTEPVKTVHMLAARRYELPASGQTPPTGTLVVVPAMGSCSPTTVNVLGHDVTISCTADLCSGAVDGTPCSDGNKCNGEETCQNHECSPGELPTIDDGNPCTIDRCDPITGVDHTPDLTPEVEDMPCEGGTGMCAPKTCQRGMCETNLTTPLICNPDLASYINPPNEPTVSEQQVGSEFRGALTGKLTVSPSGAAIYTVPIASPPGIRGMAPNLSLVYNSQGTDGIAGQGWEIGGLSTISSCDRRRAVVGAPTDAAIRLNEYASPEDGLCLDGEQLIRKRPVTTTGTAQYLTESEQFLTISRSALYNHGFKVVTKSGEVRYYGTDKKGRIDDLFLLQRVVDSWGNYFDIHYNNEHGDIQDLTNDFATNGVRVTAIDYTGNLSAGGTQPFATITFDYEERTDVRHIRSTPRKSIPKKHRLTSITTPVGTYSLTYMPEDPDHMLPSRLQQIEYCAGLGYARKCMMPLVMGWEGGGMQWEDSAAYALPARLDRPGDKKSFGTQFVDLNGDGLIDFVEAKNNTRRAWKNTGTGFVEKPDWAPKADLARADGSPGFSRFVDLDGDGMIDLLESPKLPAAGECGTFAQVTDDCLYPAPTLWINRIREKEATGDSLGAWAENHSAGDPTEKVYRAWGRIDLSRAETPPTGTGSADNHYQLADMDGDGRADLVRFGAANDSLVDVFLSPLRPGVTLWKKSPIDYKLWSSSAAGYFQLGTSSSCTLMDVNRDGLTDVACLGSSGGNVGLNTNGEPHRWGLFPFNTIKEAWQASSGDVPDVYNLAPANARYWGDIDGDGHYDYFTLYPLTATDFCGAGSGGTCTEPLSIRSEPGTRNISLGTGFGFQTGPQSYLDVLNAVIAKPIAVRTSRTDQTIPKTHVFTMADINADGLADLIVSKVSGEGRLFVNTGTTWIETETSPNAPPPPPNSHIPLVPTDVFPNPFNDRLGSAFVDLDGDGVLDLVATAYDETTQQVNGRTWLNRFKAPRITNFSNGLAKPTQLSYAVITTEDARKSHGDRPATYSDPDHGTLADGTRYMVAPLAVVQGVTDEDGTGSGTTFETQYRYRSLRQSTTARGPQGFREVSVYDPRSGITVTTEYLQVYPYTGRVHVVTKKKGPYLLSETTTTYCDTVVENNGVPQCTPLSGPSAGAPYAPVGGVNGSGKSVFVFVDSITDKSFLWGDYDPSASEEDPPTPVRTVETATDFKYDAFGNLVFNRVLVTSYTTNRLFPDEASKTETVNSYASASGEEERLGKLRLSTVTTTQIKPADSNSPPIVHKTAFTYGFRRTEPTLALELETKTIEPDRDAPFKLVTAYAYDEFGNLVTTTACQGQFEGCVANAANPAGVSEPPFRTTTLSYDPATGHPETLPYGKGRFPVWSSNAAGHKEYFRYDATTGQRLKAIDPNFIKTCYQYDVFGRLESETARCESAKPLTTTTKHHLLPGATLETARQVVSVVRPATGGATWTYSDVFGRAIYARSQNLVGSIVTSGEKTFDAQGRVHTERKPYLNLPYRFYETVSEYDELGRVASVDEDLGEIHPALGSSTHTSLTMKYNGLEVTTKRSVLGPGQTGIQEQKRIETKNVLGKVSSVSVADSTAVLTVIYYAYDADGNLTCTGTRSPCLASESSDPTKNVLAIKYDWRGRKKESHDPDMGTWTYAYNGFGDLVGQTDPKNSVTMTYDTLGRMTSRTDAEGTAQWVYDVVRNSEAGIGKLAAMAGPHDPKLTGPRGTIIRDINSSGDNRAGKWFQYSTLGELEQVSEVIDGETFTTTHEYDEFGRQVLTKYPLVNGSRLQVGYHYNVLGYLQYVYDVDDQHIYWAATGADARGQVTAEHTRNGVETFWNWHQSTGWLMGSTSTAHADGGKLIQSWSYDYDQVGNLRLRNRADQVNLLPSQEIFDYDPLNRLKTSQVKIGASGPTPAYDVTETYAYDTLGNLTSKNNKTYTYTGCMAGTRAAGPHAVCTVDGGTAFQYDANGNLTEGRDHSVEYNSRNMVKHIASHPPTSQGNDTGTVEFVYGPDGNRVVQEVTDSAGVSRTIYVGLGGTGKSLYERTWNSSSGEYTHTHFLYAGGAHGGNAFAVRVLTTSGSSTTSNVMKYYHFDHLRSVTAVSDELGRVGSASGPDAGVLGYDPWGARRDPGGRQANPASFNLRPGHREFTGHEAIPSVGLVNMNGRVYDPVLGRFLSPDPTIQFVANLQSYNRYSYVLNNPLSYTDPTGYGIGEDIATTAIGIVAVVSAGLACAGPQAVACGAFAAIAYSAGMTYVQSINSGAGVDAAIAAAVVSGGLTAAGAGVGAVTGGLGWLIGGAVSGAVGAVMTSAITGQPLSATNILASAARGAAMAGVNQAVGAALSWASAAEAQGGYLVACNGDCDVGPHAITKSFSIDQVRGAGEVRGELFIQADSVLDSKGDGRTFDPAPNPSRSRVFFSLDFERGRGVMQVNPSCHAGGGCVDPLPWGKGNNVRIQAAGGRVSIAGTFTNALHPNAPSIDFSIQVAARSGGVSFFGSRDYYPSFELTRTYNGSTQVLLNRPEVNVFCLTGICGADRFAGASR